MASPTTHPATGTTVDSLLHTIEVPFQGITVSDAQEMVADTATWRELLDKYYEELEKDMWALCDALKREQEKDEDMGWWSDAQAEKDTERDVERRHLLANAQEKLDAELAAIYAQADDLHRPRTDDVACDVDDYWRARLRAKFIADADGLMIAKTSMMAKVANAEDMLKSARSRARDLERKGVF